MRKRIQNDFYCNGFVWRYFAREFQTIAKRSNIFTIEVVKMNMNNWVRRKMLWRHFAQVGSIQFITKFIIRMGISSEHASATQKWAKKVLRSMWSEWTAQIRCKNQFDVPSINPICDYSQQLSAVASKKWLQFAYIACNQLVWPSKCADNEQFSSQDVLMKSGTAP